mgnify:CR=1 FL=1
MHCISKENEVFNLLECNKNILKKVTLLVGPICCSQGLW